MDRPFKITLWAGGIIIGLLIIVAVIFLIYFRSATKEMTPAETSAINDSVFCIKDRFVNAYLFRTGDSYIIFDAGMSEDHFSSEMSTLGLDPGKVTAVFLTHTDGDHIGAMGLFKNSKAYMHRDEEQMVNGQNKKGPVTVIWKYGPYSLLDNNDTVRVGGLSVVIIHTPGHTPGSSCYIVNDSYIITGDNMTVADGKPAQFVEMFNMDTGKQIESLKTLPELSRFSYILTAHHGVYRN